jgi:hypothetical protein
MSFETSQVDVRFVLAVLMFPRFAHIHLHLTFVEGCVSVHPALHVCLNSARAHITPLPPASGSDDMLSSRDVFVTVFLSNIGLLRLLTLSFEDTPPMLAECLCGQVFRLGLTPYDPFCVILKFVEALLLIL